MYRLVVTLLLPLLCDSSPLRLTTEKHGGLLQLRRSDSRAMDLAHSIRVEDGVFLNFFNVKQIYDYVLEGKKSKSQKHLLAASKVVIRRHQRKPKKTMFKNILITFQKKISCHFCSLGVFCPSRCSETRAA